METMHATGRRNLPPVPRPDRAPVLETGSDEPTEVPAAESNTERFVVDLTTGEQRAVVTRRTHDPAPEVETDATVALQGRASGAAAADEGPSDEVTSDEGPSDEVASNEVASDEAASDETASDETASDEAVSESPEPDAAQLFVNELRAAAADLADVAGAQSAVIREVVPPARHRRARCRLVLRYGDASEVDVTFLGSPGRPASPSWHGFDRQIRRWLAAGQRRDDAWLVADPEAPDGLAVDLTAWATAA